MHLIDRLNHGLQLQQRPVNDLVAGIFQTSGSTQARRMLDSATLIRAETAEYQFLTVRLGLATLVCLMAGATGAERRSILFQLLTRVLLTADVRARKHHTLFLLLLLVWAAGETA